MASNFQISSKMKNNQLLTLRLFGDFDGSSAWELLHLVRKLSMKYKRVRIETCGLRNVNNFGMDVLSRNRLSSDPSSKTEIVFTGRFQSAFEESCEV
jgi:hypothetical protein